MYSVIAKFPGQKIVSEYDQEMFQLQFNPRPLEENKDHRQQLSN